MQIVEKTFAQVSTGSGVTINNLAVTPLVAPNVVERDYLTLDEALARGDARVTETSEAGDVPELRFENRGEQPVLLLDGEELVGAKQNRVLNLTILAPAKSTITIPVSCVEAGRWSHSSPEFSTKGRAFYAAGRARKADQVTASLRTRGTRRSRQGEVWEDIAAKSSRMNSYSDTAAMECLYEDYQDQVDEYLKAVEVVEGQVGAVFAINGQIRGVELFDFSTTFRKLMPKLMRSYALDAIDEQGRVANGKTPEVAHFLAAVAAADGSVHPAVGEGEDIRISGPRLAGGALGARDRVVHLCAFHLPEAGSHGYSRGSDLARSSRRMRHYRGRGGNGSGSMR
ncbi:MAG: hypothetical protein KME65_13470 [Candidatus Thiodiazotropha sp. (ex Ctena orbiculata)]|uniref:ARG and Rhodanese-Phosphatase-superfamily-associated domain-containing protein n=1 Tax=Candidatus Thiodiazotropha taylori TaxID=2792791 RepID=A0A944QTH6_9GAMM|nr:hypothetical protein [Candidatus Thiodiazotropha taylori]